ncbi:hypothetical protein EVAR_53710_1 [Eumeta japonica]|uniref:Uncharacterized protein n=1 Tax=Eumeta variegata TaxID=151549 RepID=A0A4C1YYC1_EUMVA|nr:hypothetical protein EVAR_53710_1 [Eumeta japonica]
MRAALTRSASTDVRRAAVGCVRGLSCAPPRPRRSSLHNPVPPPPAGERMRDDARTLAGGSASAPERHAGCPPPPAGCACAMIARACGWLGDGTGMTPASMDPPQKGPLPPEPSRLYPRREDARA